MHILLHLIIHLIRALTAETKPKPGRPLPPRRPQPPARTRPVAPPPASQTPTARTTAAFTSPKPAPPKPTPPKPTSPAAVVTRTAETTGAVAAAGVMTAATVAATRTPSSTPATPVRTPTTRFEAPAKPRPTPPVAMPAGFAGIDSLIAQGRVALALDKLQLDSVLPRGPKEPRAPAVLVVATALEAAIRKEPKLQRFSGEVRGVASIARSVNELREEHDNTPSKQLRHEIDALESRCVRELGHALEDMKGALAPG